MAEVTDEYALSDFQHNIEEHIERLKKSGQPEVLTVNGKPAVVVQDAETYRALLEVVERAGALEGVQRGLESMARGGGRPAADVLEQIRQKHASPGAE